MIQTASDLFDNAQQWLFEAIVQPLFFNLGLSGYLEDAYNGTMWLLIGLIQITLIATVFGALQRWRPVEPVVNRREIRNDIVYTLIHRLGVFRLSCSFQYSQLPMHYLERRVLRAFQRFTLTKYGQVSQISPG